LRFFGVAGGKNQPGKVMVNGEEVPTKLEAGHLKFNVPAGSHRFELLFEKM
tara:strand:- start:233 stop:385 length:153 start_codon:yes stop_codon:yes gene_type:complete